MKQGRKKTDSFHFNGEMVAVSEFFDQPGTGSGAYGQTRWTWKSFKEEPTFTVVMESRPPNLNRYFANFGSASIWTEHQIATGLTRHKATELAALLLNSPKYNRATLAEEEDEGEWVLDENFKSVAKEETT